MVYWKTSQPQSEPWSLTMSFMEWPSHAVNDQRHSRVHDCCVTATLQGWLQARGTTRLSSAVSGRNPPPGMWLCSKACPPRHPRHQVLGVGDWTDWRDDSIFREWQTDHADWVRVPYLPPALAPRTTYWEDLFRRNLYEEVVQSNKSPNKPPPERTAAQAPLESQSKGPCPPQGPAATKPLERTFHSTEREETRWQLEITCAIAQEACKHLRSWSLFSFLTSLVVPITSP